MTDNDIIKALDICGNKGIDIECAECPYCRHFDCGADSAKDALDLITRQKAENERLQSMNQSKLDMIHDLRAEIERLKKEIPENKYGNRVRVKNGLICTNTLDDYDRLIGDISYEAIKEFAEIARKDIPNIANIGHFEKTIMINEINAVERMLLERNGR